jgi:hypothetical protein
MPWNSFARAVILAAASSWPIQCSNDAGPGVDADRDPVVVWNRMVEAKGGRERLHSIETFRIALREKVSIFTRYPDLVSKHTEQIFALPDRLWEWYDFRPDPTSSTSGYQFDSRLWNTTGCWRWSGTNGGRAHFESYRDDCFLARDYREHLLLYLLETKDFQPVPVRVSPAGRHRARVEVKALDFDSVTYLIDTRTNLVLEATVVPLLRKTWDGSNDMVKGVPIRHALEGVQYVSGIAMPKRFDGADVTAEINPPVDPRLFTIPPDGVSDADAWRAPARPRPTSYPRVGGQFYDALFRYSIDLPDGYRATDIVDQQGFRITSARGDIVLVVSVGWLPPDTLAEAADQRAVQILARHGNLAEASRRPSQLGGLPATEIVFADAAQSSDVNYTRLIVANRETPRATYAIALQQRTRSDEGDAIFREVARSFTIVPAPE